MNTLNESEKLSHLENLENELSSINDYDKYGHTKLTNAIDNHQLSDIKLLLKHGADINLKSKGGDSPLSIALSFYNDSNNILKYLLMKGADVNSLHLVSLILRPTRTDSLSKLEPLLTNEAFKGHLVNMSMLIAYKANLDTISEHGYTALTIAALNGQFEAVQLLLDKGANTQNTYEQFDLIKRANNHKVSAFLENFFLNQLLPTPTKSIISTSKHHQLRL